MSIMSLSRRAIGAFICVFVVGILVGGLIVFSLRDTSFSGFLSRTGDPAALSQRFEQRLQTDYHLDATQEEKIKPLTAAMAQRIVDLRRQFGTDVLATFDEYHAKIALELTPDQRAAYEKLNAQRRARASQMLLPPSAPNAEAQK